MYISWSKRERCLSQMSQGQQNGSGKNVRLKTFAFKQASISVSVSQKATVPLACGTVALNQPISNLQVNCKQRWTRERERFETRLRLAGRPASQPASCQVDSSDQQTRRRMNIKQSDWIRGEAPICRWLNSASKLPSLHNNNNRQTDRLTKRRQSTYSKCNIEPVLFLQR